MAPAEETVAPAPAADAPVAEPAAKRPKLDDEAKAAPADAAPQTPDMAGWPDHTLNANLALDKKQEGKLFSELAAADVEVLQGLGPKSKVLLEECSIKTVADLAEFKFYKSAKAIAALAPAEEAGKRAAMSKLNVDQAVTAEYETKSLTDILASPISALEGVGEVLSTMLGELNVKTVGDLAVFKYCQWAEAIVTLATLEHSKSKKERTAENMLKKLA